MSEKSSVFAASTMVKTRKSARDAGADSHILINRKDDASYSAIEKAAFINNVPAGQSQSIIKSDDQDEIIRVDRNQLTNAVGKIVVESEGECILIKARTNVTLEVGASKLILEADGTIRLIGVKISVEGESILSQATEQNIILGKRVDINP